MSKPVETMYFVDTNDSLVRVLQSWRMWLVGALVGALVASLVYWAFPPSFRARAVVVVDHNLEEIWYVQPTKQFYFLGRESRKLEELAWSDETMQLVADRVGDVSIRELREEILSLSQPYDGGWHFFADDPDLARAEEIASAWAQVFYDQVYDAIEISADLEIMRSELPLILEQNPDMSSGEALNMVKEMNPGLKETKGISPYIELSLAQLTDLHVVRKVPLAVYILAGAVIGACTLALISLVIIPEKDEDVLLAD